MLKNYDDITLDQLELMWLYGTKVKRYDDDGNEIKAPIGSLIRDAKIIQELNTPTRKAIKRKWDMQDRIFDRVDQMQEPYFATFTLSDNSLKIDYKRAIKKLFKKLNLNDWVLITDYGEENGRIHFHGYVDLVSVSKDEILACPTRKYPLGVQLFEYRIKYGYNLLTPLKRDLNDLRKTIGYTLKYITKGDELEFKHEMFASRKKSNDLYRDLPF